MAYVPPSDWELKDFIRDHAEAVYRSCGFLTLGRGDAGEMTREIFLKVLNQGMEFRSEQDARAWMILTAYQMSRKIPKNAEVSEQGRELLKLKRKDLLVALLYYCEGYRKKEIADYLGCTEASVRRRLARVKRRLAVEEPEDTAREEAEAAEIMRRWYENSQELANSYPDFDMTREINNPKFIKLVQNGIDLKTAYEVVHLADILNNEKESAASAARTVEIRLL